MNPETKLPQDEQSKKTAQTPTTQTLSLEEKPVEKSKKTEVAPSKNLAEKKAESSEETTPGKQSFLKKLFPKKETDSSEPKPRKKKTWLQIVLGVLAAFFVLILIAGFYTYRVGMELKAQAQEAELIARTAYDQFKAQNLPGAQGQVAILQEKMGTIDSTYQRLSFYNFVPIVRNYYQDGKHGLEAAQHGLNAGEKALAELVPYADVLGFQGEGSFSGGTAEDRIRIIIETLDKVVPSFDAIADELTASKEALEKINPNRYPEQIRGVALRQRITEAQTTMSGAVEGFISFRPVLEELPEIAGGKDGRKKYLILFQNDNELRPTGGFLTAYAVIYVENGKVTPEKSDDIYELDQRFRERIAIPEALGKYLTTERYWNLRDMNISPDFKLSMEQFFEHYQEVPGEPDNIDGIIAVDTEVLKDLLEVLGPVTIPGGGTFSAEPDDRCGGCAQVVYALSEIITKPTPYLREDRKGILGPLMQVTLQKAYSAPKEKWPELFTTMWQDLEARHIQMYFLDENAQAAAEAVNGAGRLTPPEEGTDFLAIVNANLGGAKSNLFTEYAVQQVVNVPENGRLEKTVEITYKNTRRADNCNLEAGQLCLNSTLRDWTRLYLPAGSELVSGQGFTTEPITYEENGFTVIDGFFVLEPLGTAKLKLTYTVPYTDSETYRVQLWKQGGIDPVENLFDVNGGEEKVLVTKDTTLEVAF